MPLPLHPAAAVKEGAKSVWNGVKSAMPESCLGGVEGAKEAVAEKLNFAQFARNRRENVEMTNMPPGEGGAPGAEGAVAIDGMEGQAVGPDGMPVGGGAPGKLSRGVSQASCSTAGGEGGGGEMITEWQAGWNVTNAIQVGRVGSGFCCRPLHLYTWASMEFSK